jgi:flagellar hook-associated protein 1 FlgK
MAGLFNAIEIGKRALATNQLWLNTIGHNIANVNTPGYTRQRVTITTTQPFDHPVGPVGTGVKATDIRQIRDLFLTQQFRQENKALGKWTSMDKTLSQIEALFNEPNSDSLGDLMDKFWASWSDLANNPESVAARSALVEQGNILATGFNRIYRQLLDIEASVDEDVNLTVLEVNNLAEELASLNMQIARSELGGENANDLRDKRDYLIDQLSELVDINVAEQDNGTATVYIGALAIVEGTSAFRIGTYKSGAGATAVSQVVWEGTTKSIKVHDGRLRGLLDTRDDVIPEYMQALNDLTETLITNVNALHQTGFGLDGSTGWNFFSTIDMSAAGIRVAGEIQNDVNRIAASQSGEVGDNRNALAIADLRNAGLMSRGSATMGEYYRGLIGRVGVETDKATSLKENYELLVTQLENARQSVQGVSLDEEMTQMIKFQSAYDAAARVITTMDEALETVVNKMGIVGR